MVKIVSSGRALHSPEFYEKAKKYKKRRILLVLFGLILIIIALVYGLRHEALLIKEIRVLGASVMAEEELRLEVESLLDKRYLWLIPKRNFLLYPRKEIKENIKIVLPRIKSIETAQRDNSVLEIKVEERIPKSLLCEAGTRETLAGCFFMDDEGFVFASAPEFSEGVYFVFSVDGLDETYMGKFFLDSVEYGRVSLILAGFEALELLPKELHFRKDEEEVMMKYDAILSKSGRITWNAGGDPELILGNLRAFISSTQVSEKKDFFEKLLYIDLSIPNKVFYKFK